MRRGLKVVAWVTTFAAAATLGAVVAAHSNPFPPGVEDPGVPSIPTETPSASPTVAASQAWALSFRSDTAHELFVGGSCTTHWRGHVVFTVDQQEHMHGTGQVEIVGSLACDFPNVQVQVRRIHLDLQGQRFGARFLFRIAERGRVPVGARDYGGFTNTLLRRPLKVAVGGGATTIRLERGDETGRGRFVSTTRFGVRCSAGCA
jgi:hypothetical protein